MFGRSSADGPDRNTSIQSDETPALINGERQKVGIGYMPRTKDPVPHQTTRMQQADGISPERVRRVLSCFGQPLGHLRGGNRVGITGLRKYPDASVLGNRT